MAKRGDPKITRLVVVFLRFRAEMTQKEFGDASGVDQAAVSRYELGDLAPSEETLRRMAKAAGLGWHVVAHLHRFIGTILSGDSSQGPVDTRGELEILAAARLAMAPFLLEFRGVAHRLAPQEARHEAEEVWEALAPLPHLRRQWLLEISVRASRSWAMAERLGHESERAAAHNSAEALHLAELALFVAERVPREERSRTLGYCWAFLANARRVANDFDGADQAFTLARDFWSAGAGQIPFAEWRLLDLEASLRREQHRFAEALDLLDQARVASQGNPMAALRILLKREHVLAQSGNFEGALAVLAEVAPLLEDLGEPRLVFAHRFNRADNLYHLKRYVDAAALLQEVWNLAAQQANELDQVRTRWLQGRVQAGLGQKEDALGNLEQVQREFTDRKLPYDAALASLEVAVLWLEEGRTAEVRTLAVGMAWIFKAQGIQREALAALSLFREAALQEAASVDLVRRVIAEVEAARRSAPRSG